MSDVVLNLLIEKEQFFSYPNLKPGILNPLRSNNVDYKKLACVASKHGLDRCLQHKKSQLGDMSFLCSKQTTNHTTSRIKLAQLQ